MAPTTASLPTLSSWLFASSPPAPPPKRVNEDDLTPLVNGLGGAFRLDTRLPQGPTVQRVTIVDPATLAPLMHRPPLPLFDSFTITPSAVTVGVHPRLAQRLTSGLSATRAGRTTGPVAATPPAAAAAAGAAQVAEPDLEAATSWGVRVDLARLIAGGLAALPDPALASLCEALAETRVTAIWKRAAHTPTGMPWHIRLMLPRTWWRSSCPLSGAEALLLMTMHAEGRLAEQPQVSRLLRLRPRLMVPGVHDIIGAGLSFEHLVTLYRAMIPELVPKTGADKGAEGGAQPAATRSVPALSAPATFDCGPAQPTAVPAIAQSHALTAAVAAFLQARMGLSPSPLPAPRAGNLHPRADTAILHGWLFALMHELEICLVDPATLPQNESQAWQTAFIASGVILGGRRYAQMQNTATRRQQGGLLGAIPLLLGSSSFFSQRWVQGLFGIAGTLGPMLIAAMYQRRQLNDVVDEVHGQALSQLLNQHVLSQRHFDLTKFKAAMDQMATINGQQR